MKKSIIHITFLFVAIIQFGYGQDIEFQPAKKQKPIDGIVERKTVKDRMVLEYAPIRENDILWEKRIWREIPTFEKMNLPFRYPEMPFFDILKDGIESGQIVAYSADDDKFTTRLAQEQLALQFYRKDTIEVVDPDNENLFTTKVVETEINSSLINRYRIKEVWFFDTNLSTMRTRILGIAPIKEEFDENGNFLFEYPLFWIYYPHCREYLSEFPVFNQYGNDKQTMTWEDLFEMRFFASYITKESNVQDRRLQDYLSGRDLLLEADKIKQEIFNYEHDLWSY